MIDGCPPRLPITAADIQPDLDRRAPGQSELVTQRKESDTVRILSGVFEGKTLGTPISLVIPNEDSAPGDYGEVQREVPARATPTTPTTRSTASATGAAAGARARARPSARVAAGAIAQKLLAERCGVEIVAWVSKVGRLSARLRPEKRDARGRSTQTPSAARSPPSRSA